MAEELRQGRCVFVHCISGESRAPVRSRQNECPLCVRTHGVGGGNRVPFDAPAETVETDAAGRLSFLTQGAFNLVSPLLDCPLSASLRRIALAGFCPTWGPPPPGLIWCFLDTRPGQPCLFDKPALQTSPLRKDGRYEQYESSWAPQGFSFARGAFSVYVIECGGGADSAGGWVMGAGGADVTAKMPAPPPETSKPH